jgi:hypothetical protein
MKEEMKNNENEIKKALGVLYSFKKFATIDEAIATRDFISDYQKQMKKKGSHTFAGLKSICMTFLRNGCATREERRLQAIAENYIKAYTNIQKIYSTITNYEKNDFLLGYTKADYEKEILSYINY